MTGDPSERVLAAPPCRTYTPGIERPANAQKNGTASFAGGNQRSKVAGGNQRGKVGWDLQKQDETHGRERGDRVTSVR